MHFLVLAEQARWDDVTGALVEHRDFLRQFVSEQAVQTNEVQRSWELLPCFLEVALRAGADALDLIELGSSAGLNLVWDRYHYRYEAGEWGPVDAPLSLVGEERRAVPRRLLESTPVVRRRVGIDLEPIDVTGDEGARLLKCFVWADQHERLERLDRAIDALRQDPPELLRGDYVDQLPELLERRRDGALTIVYQTASMVYLSPEQRARVHEALAAAGRTGPLAWVSTTRTRDEGLSGHGLEIRVWPGGERELVAQGDFHGSWIEWLAG